MIVLLDVIIGFNFRWAAFLNAIKRDLCKKKTCGLEYVCVQEWLFHQALKLNISPKKRENAQQIKSTITDVEDVML